MTAKNKSESLIQKIVVGIIITVASSLILAWYNGAFDSNSNNPSPKTPEQQKAAIQEELHKRG